MSPSGSVAFVASDATGERRVRQLLTGHDGAGNATWGRVISNPGARRTPSKRCCPTAAATQPVTGTTTVGGDVNFFTTYVNGVSGNEIWRNVDGASGGPGCRWRLQRDASNNVMWRAAAITPAGVHACREIRRGARQAVVIDPPMGPRASFARWRWTTPGALLRGGDVLIKFSLGGAEQWRVSPGIVAQAVTVDSSGAVIVAGSNGGHRQIQRCRNRTGRNAVNGVEDANNVVYALGTDVERRLFGKPQQRGPASAIRGDQDRRGGLYVWRMEFPTADIEGNVPPAMRGMADRSVYLPATLGQRRSAFDDGVENHPAHACTHA